MRNKYFLLRRLSGERVFRMTKKKIEDFLTNSEKEELLENYKCLREAKQRIIKDAGIHDENAATVQSKRKALF